MNIFTDKSIRTLFAVSLSAITALTSAVIFAKPTVWLLALAATSDIIIIMAFLWYFKKQNSIIEDAQIQIADYLSGNKKARIECDSEGELYKLFHSVNALVAVLNAHAENELRSKEFLKNTISDISHQLKTPLAALNIYNEIIKDEGAASPETQKFCSLSEGELDRINVLVQNLLKITKLDAGTIIIDKKTEDLSALINEIVTQFKFRAANEGKEITAFGDDNIFLLCDRNWIFEALGNIVKNALDHTKQGDKIDIEYRQLSSLIQLKITDNGSGIHPDDIHHIFKRFYRSRFSKDTSGLGLGLSLAKTIIELHAGSIEVDSKLEQGTVFTVNFLIPTKL